MMNKLGFSLLLLLLSFKALAQRQDTVYYNRAVNSIDNPRAAVYYGIKSYATADKTRGTEVVFRMNGAKLYQKPFDRGEKPRVTGPVTYWYENGQVSQAYQMQDSRIEGRYVYYYDNGQVQYEQIYQASKPDGPATGYYRNGKVKRRETFKNGELKQGQCFGISGQDTTYFSFKQQPEFRGGDTAMNLFIRAHLKYPKEALKAGVEGLAVVYFVVDTTGKISDVLVVKKVHPAIDQESVRVVTAMPDMIPAYQDGEPVEFHYYLPLRFGMR